MYRSLDADKTGATIEKLHQRIVERFPASGLARVCSELSEVARASKLRADSIARPNIPLRLTLSILIALTLALLAYSISLLNFSFANVQAGELVQVIDAGMNEIVLIGATIFFLVSAELRIRRSRALRALHELRSIAHVIDMHQLTKDPSRIEADVVWTSSSPLQALTAFELTRYLDYCSEMLSLTGKIAALYAQTLNDDVVLSAVNELESLTTGLSRKIWQKIMILQRLKETN